MISHLILLVTNPRSILSFISPKEYIMLLILLSKIDISIVTMDNLLEFDNIIKKLKFSRREEMVMIFKLFY